jgi:hypothetical protein
MLLVVDLLLNNKELFPPGQAYAALRWFEFLGHFIGFFVHFCVFGGHFVDFWVIFGFLELFGAFFLFLELFGPFLGHFSSRVDVFPSFWAHANSCAYRIIST